MSQEKVFTLITTFWFLLVQCTHYWVAVRMGIHIRALICYLTGDLAEYFKQIFLIDVVGIWTSDMSNMAFILPLRILCWNTIADHCLVPQFTATFVS